MFSIGATYVALIIKSLWTTFNNICETIECFRKVHSHKDKCKRQKQRYSEHLFDVESFLDRKTLLW